MVKPVQFRNAETLRTQSFRPPTSSASPRFKSTRAEHGYVLTPGRYVGAGEVENDGVPFAEKMERLHPARFQPKSLELAAQSNFVLNG